MNVTRRYAHIFELEEDGSIGFDFTTIHEGEEPLWADFRDYVERRRAEREEMYDKEYVCHIGERDYKAKIEVHHP